MRQEEKKIYSCCRCREMKIIGKSPLLFIQVLFTQETEKEAEKSGNL